MRQEGEARGALGPNTMYLHSHASSACHSTGKFDLRRSLFLGIQVPSSSVKVGFMFLICPTRVGTTDKTRRRWSQDLYDKRSVVVFLVNNALNRIWLSEISIVLVLQFYIETRPHLASFAKQDPSRLYTALVYIQALIFKVIWLLVADDEMAFSLRLTLTITMKPQ